jgi:transcriptional regulator with XRE-family HTH domain
MGTKPRRRAARLAEKLLQIRTALALSQNEMISRMGLTEDLLREEISDFERGKREPALPFLLQYARAAGVCLDVLVDDELDLPDKLPSSPKHEGVRRTSTARSNKSNR